MKFRILTFLAAPLLVASFALAQVAVPTVTTVNPTDLIQVIPGGQPSAGSKYANAGQVNGPLGLQSSVPVTAFSITLNNGTSYYLIRPAGTLATGTFTFDANAGNGQRACIQSTQTQTAVTIAGGTGQTIGGSAVTAMVAGTTYCWIYVTVTATWYPITV